MNTFDIVGVLMIILNFFELTYAKIISVRT